MTLEERKQSIVNNFSTSSWLRNAILALDQRDIVDVNNELDILKEYFEEKFWSTSMAAVIRNTK